MQTVRQRPALAAALAATAFLMAPVSAPGAILYTVTQVGGLRDQGQSLSSNGTVVGGFNTAAPTTGFLWSGGTAQNLGNASSGANTYIRGVNNAGTAAGEFLPSFSSGIFHATIWDGTAWIDLHPSLGTTASTRANGINDSGVVVGDAGSQAFIRTSGGVISLLSDLRSLGGINNSGQAAGMNTSNQAVIREADGTLTSIPLVSTFSAGAAISNSGHVVGVFFDSGGTLRTFLYTPGVGVTTVGGLGSSSLNAQSVNSSGVVVGASNSRAVALLGGVMTDLNTLIDPMLNIYLGQATDINDAGQILVHGAFGSSWPTLEPYTFLLTPINTAEVPEPSTCAMLGAGLIAAVTAQRRS